MSCDDFLRLCLRDTGMPVSARHRHDAWQDSCSILYISNGICIFLIIDTTVYEYVCMYLYICIGTFTYNINIYIYK